MDMIRNRLKKNHQRLKNWIKDHQIEAWRAYDRDIPDYPYIIDLYKDFAVVYEKGKEDVDSSLRLRHQQDVQKALTDVFAIPPQHIILKERKKQKGTWQYGESESTSTLSEEAKEEILIREGKALFSINPFDYLDTGLFLDHRPLRQMIYSQALGKKFLNLFSYTGTMSVMAALGGANQTTSVDMSPTYQQWAQFNFSLNQLSLAKNHLIRENALHFLSTPSREKYDLIFLDPPTFSNSKRMDQDFEVERDQILLVESCMKLLVRSGTLYFSGNKRSFKISPNLKSRYVIEDISPKTIPLDFRDTKIHFCYKIQFPS